MDADSRIPWIADGHRFPWLADVSRRHWTAVPGCGRDAAMSTLADRSCVPCRGGVAPLDAEKIAPLLAQIEGWQVVGTHHLHRRYELRNFVEALALVNRIAAIAEEQNHHPDILLAWGKVEVSIWTHTIDGLTESDFVFAAKCERAFATS